MHLQVSCRKVLLTMGRPFISLLCMNGFRKVFWLCGASISGNEALFWSARLRAVTMENLLISGCGLSHESVEDGCKASWVKF